MGMMQSKVPSFEIIGVSILHKSNLHNWSFDWGAYGINLMFVTFSLLLQCCLLMYWFTIMWVSPANFPLPHYHSCQIGISQAEDVQVDKWFFLGGSGRKNNTNINSCKEGSCSSHENCNRNSYCQRRHNSQSGSNRWRSFRGRSKGFASTVRTYQEPGSCCQV